MNRGPHLELDVALLPCVMPGSASRAAAILPLIMSLERNGLTKTKSHGDYFIKKIKLKTESEEVDFIED